MTSNLAPEPAPRNNPRNYRVAQLDEVPAVPCPCGQARRAFAGGGNTTATMHLTDVTADARTHYHKRMTEIYLFFEGEGHMELDGKMVPVKPMTAVFIKPGCRHRAVAGPGSKLRIANVPVPAFDPQDEWFDDGPAGAGTPGAAPQG